MRPMEIPNCFPARYINQEPQNHLASRIQAGTHQDSLGQREEMAGHSVSTALSTHRLEILAELPLIEYLPTTSTLPEWWPENPDVSPR